MLISELKKIMVNKTTFVDFRGGDRSNLSPGSTPTYCWRSVQVYVLDIEACWTCVSFSLIHLFVDVSLLKWVGYA